MKNEVYNVSKKLPPLDVYVEGIDKDFNSYRCAYNGEFWYDEMTVCDAPRYWSFIKDE